MSMLEYIQRTRHLISCITTHPVDMATQVHVFIPDMSAGYQRFYLTWKTPSTLEEAFAVALLEDYSMTASQAFDVSRDPASEPEPKPMEIDAIGFTTALVAARFASDEMLLLRQARTSRGCVPRSSASGGERHDRERRGQAKKRRQPVGAGHPTGSGRGDGSLVTEPPPSLPVLRAQRSATTSGSNSRLIVLSLRVDGTTRPIRALLDSGTMSNFVRAERLPVLPVDMRVREEPGHMIVKYADGKPRRLPRRSVTFSYAFDGFQGLDDFLVIELSGPSTVTLASRGSLVTSPTSTD
ncbi:hypothetical protein PC129_g19640 [Phytophthora cactorum]|uniref:Aspartic peptidase domain n=3 Tax=Phytophthora cactorum TaxID=29920 RepID=A0A8T0Y382_9STRA|nr:hypothetical protein Pcac1_g7462 [Phytophthora cactorum]KAG2800101.1 hypothetical protein PC112_g20631 [Phytophthora cactorum]KAG2800299.1 hypothetical protein PC111_g20030 [Phytophthora cactorum]KAG2833520.1 hypothetical protein PC113_g20557 [Phytophthora cactorum]KAG2876636.1 hypothetical protein PC115_g23567 [Phytophthora cactorum]